MIGNEFTDDVGIFTEVFVAVLYGSLTCFRVVPRIVYHGI